MVQMVRKRTKKNSEVNIQSRKDISRHSMYTNKKSFINSKLCFVLLFDLETRTGSKVNATLAPGSVDE